MKKGISLILQLIFLIIVLGLLINSLINFPDIETIHIVIQSICVGIVSCNFSLTLYSYLKRE